ncbi:hypothetical protein SCOCK_20232 [Actinacidiphila cocklensis]|uniref:Uncharacterized protein n=1 Tax=Actinacidiphila cocklensis TaxID=887465 RepID=A0A9W4E4M2_9ACTN|nr:hypothetical protein SCOCK_20232 [Actinacidiphila cocklensis]
MRSERNGGRTGLSATTRALGSVRRKGAAPGTGAVPGPDEDPVTACLPSDNEQVDT